jgi:hypothetical protein
VGLDERAIIAKFGYPVYRKKLSKDKPNEITWIYIPFRGGREKLSITISNGKVKAVDYGKKEK